MLIPVASLTQVLTVSLAMQARYTKLPTKAKTTKTVVTGSQPLPMRGIRAIFLLKLALQFYKFFIES